MVATSPNAADISVVPDRLEPKDWTETVYQAALAELEPIFGAKQGTPDSERALRLFDAIEAYESVHYPMSEPTQQSIAEYERDKWHLAP